MKAKLIDGTVCGITRADIVNGHLEIDVQNKTAEEVQEVFSVPGSLETIQLLTDEDDVFGELTGWTVYGGVMLNGDVKTAILTKPVDITEERLTTAEADALAARTTAEEVQKSTADNSEQITDLQMALCEIYEGMEV